MKLVNNRLFFVFILALGSMPSWALKNDTQQPINIESDNQSLDMENNTLTLTNNVVISQGSILIKANEVIIKRPAEGSGKKETVDAKGNPVTFRQIMDDGKLINGKANAVHYDLNQEFLTLTNNAQLQQLDSKINGDVITYDVKKQHLKAMSGKTGKVKTVLIPNQLDDKEGKK